MLKVCIDPGHGGKETGAVANGFTEKDLNLKLANLFQAELNRCGIETAMTRTADVDMSLFDRGVFAKNNKCTCMVSLHFNADGDSGAHGTEIFYSFLPEAEASSHWLADRMIEEVILLGTYQRGVFKKESESIPGHNYFGVLRNSEPIPGVLTEGLFIDNAGDVAILKKPGYLKNLAIAYAKGLCKAYGCNYVQDPATLPVSIPAPVEIKALEIPYQDWLHVGSYAKEAVLALHDAGIMHGDGINFHPEQPVTRQDFAVVLYNVLKKNKLI